MKNLTMLLSPIKIGKMELKNRMIQAPMHTGQAADDGNLTERGIAYYTARARGGFAWLSPGAVAVHPRGIIMPRAPGLWDDKHIAGWRKLASAAHEHGAKLVPQLHHAGNKAFPNVIGAQPLGPSPLSYPVTRGRPAAQSNTPIAQELTVEEIEEIVEAFGEAARRARDAGCDGIALHGAHGYLLAQFMSPAENKRTDDYGGGTRGRLKLPLDVIKRIKARTGNLPVILRMNADELIPGGLYFEEAQLMAWLLADGGVDCLDLSHGSNSHTFHAPIPTSGLPPATWITQHTWLVKQALDIPIIASGKINDPLMAEFILQTRKADLISFGRASLADPELPNKVAAGKLDDIRLCIHCMSCTGGGLGHFGCAMNPGTGQEFQASPLVPAGKPRKVLVAGGGPGGLEAARVAALRGHRVTLCEKSERLGGQFWIGALPPGKQELTEGIKWLDTQARKAGVKIELGKEVTPALVGQLKPDVVIVATGAAPLVPDDIPGMDRPNVITAHDVLTEKARCGARVVVLGASMVGCEVADWLGLHGKQVTMIKMRPGTDVAEDVGFPMKIWLVDQLEHWKVKVISGSAQGIKIKRVIDQGVVILRDGQEETIDADSVVLALGTRPVNTLVEQLKSAGPEVHVIGDAKESRRVWNAIEEGATIGHKI